MQNLYLDTRKLDEACCAEYGVSEEVMMENAAAALEAAVRCADAGGRQRVLVLCGGGNNGADGYALARRIRIDFDVVVFQCAAPKSPLCILQASRAEKCGARFFELEDFTLEFLANAGVVVDCIFGSGFHGNLSEKIQCLLNDVNDVDLFRIACDVPTGVREDGTVAQGAFRAVRTVCMGALKMALYSDAAKDVAGEISCAELGVGRRLFENASGAQLKVGSLLDESDLMLPRRGTKSVHKGSFGHAVVAQGEKPGAAVVAAGAALRFGAGLVSVVDAACGGAGFVRVPPEIMASVEFPANMNALAFGMGLGRAADSCRPYFDFLTAHHNVACVIDADACHSPLVRDFLEARPRRTVLTPHPKEFQALLKHCGLGDLSVEECIVRRRELIEQFCRTFPKSVLLVKGANTMIGYYDSSGYGRYHFFVNPHGRPCLAKGGSGDVLSGLVCALLAQKYRPLDAAITASLAHALASQKITCDYAMTPFDLIDALKEVEETA